MELTDKVALLSEFSWRQYIHDRYFHQDIFVLNKQMGIKHFILHMAKYQSRLFGDTVNYRTLVDIFIITVALARTMNYDSESLLSKCEGKQLPPMTNDELFRTVVENTALAAKVCEGLDHVEVQDFHGNLIRVIDNYVLVIFDLMERGKHKIDFEQLIKLAELRLVHIELYNPMVEYHWEVIYKEDAPKEIAKLNDQVNDLLNRLKNEEPHIVITTDSFESLELLPVIIHGVNENKLSFKGHLVKPL